jgi:hypothetical protein
MEQLSTVAWGFMMIVTVLMGLGVAAMLFGADSRPCIGDEHTGTPRTDWI